LDSSSDQQATTQRLASAMELKYLSSYSIVAICASTICVILLTSGKVESASVIHHQKRSAAVVSPQSSNDIFEECNDGAPCGWEVYEPHTRNLAYYVQSSCKCKARETCVQTDDDLRISAYVYKCRVIPRRRPRPSSSTSPASTRDSAQNSADS